MLSVDDLYNSVSSYLSPKDTGYGLNANSQGSMGINPNQNPNRTFGSITPPSAPPSPITPSQPQSNNQAGNSQGSPALQMLARFQENQGHNYVPALPGNKVAPLPPPIDSRKYFNQNNKKQGASDLDKLANKALGYGNSENSLLQNLGDSALSSIAGLFI